MFSTKLLFQRHFSSFKMCSLKSSLLSKDVQIIFFVILLIYQLEINSFFTYFSFSSTHYFSTFWVDFVTLCRVKILEPSRGQQRKPFEVWKQTLSLSGWEHPCEVLLELRGPQSYRIRLSGRLRAQHLPANSLIVYKTFKQRKCFLCSFFLPFLHSKHGVKCTWYLDEAEEFLPSRSLQFS